MTKQPEVDMFADIARDTIDVFGDDTVRSTIEGMQQPNYGRRDVARTLGEDLRLDQSARASQKTEQPVRRTAHAEKNSSRFIGMEQSERSKTSQSDSRRGQRDQAQER